MQGEPDVLGSTFNPKQKNLHQGKVGEMEGSFDQGGKIFEQFAC